MKKTNLIIIAALVAAAAIGTTTALVINNKNGFGVFAGVSLNEYGCVSNCTGEYYVSHVNRIVKSNPSNYEGVQNVRIIAKASAKKGWFQDVDMNAKFTTIKANDLNFNRLITVAPGNTYGYSYSAFQEGDIIAFFGEIHYVEKGYPAPVVEIKNPTFYKWNEKQNLDLLQPVTYLE